MRESIYNIKIKYKDLFCLYNTKTSKLIVSKINYDKLFLQQSEKMKSNGFLVEKDFDEFQEVVDRRKKYLDSDKDYKRYTIFPTTKCNAKCSFCYENDSPRFDMTDKVVEETIEFIKKDIGNKKKMRIYWFGGEPLVRRDIIDKISKALIEFCDRKGISLQSSIATNLSLFKEKDIQYAIDNWHLNKIEFAFDGDHDQHNLIKNYNIKNFDAFNHNMEMIGKLLEKNITVQIRFNVDKNTFNDAMILARNILKKYHGNKKLKLYLGFIFKTPQNNSPAKEDLIEMKSIGKYSIKFFELLKQYKHCGVEDLPLMYKINNCYASNKDSLVIGSSGLITKCQMCPDSFLNKIGNVVSGVDILSDNYKKWCNNLYFKNCITCKMYPICLTGCIGQKYIYNNISCCTEKFYLKELLVCAIKMLEQDNQLVVNKILSLKKKKR